MLRTAPSLRLLVAACLMQACTTLRYIPVSEAASRQDREALQKLTLNGSQFALSCRWKPAYAKLEPAPGICEQLTQLLLALHGKVEGAAEEESGEEDQGDAAGPKPTPEAEADEPGPRLRLEVELRSQPPKYSTFDHTLLWLTWGLYPASVDSWHTVQARVRNDHGLVLQQGEFRALFRSWLGWGYWLADKAMGVIERQRPKADVKLENSQDFYAFVAHLAYDAAMQEQASAALESQEAAP